MFESIRTIRRSVVSTWLLSYVIIIMLPLALGYLVYRNSSEALRDEIHEANDSLLKQVRENMDNQLSSMEQLSFELTWNVQVKELLYSHKYTRLPNEYAYDLYLTAKSMKQYGGAYPSVDLFYIYLFDNKTVLLPGTARVEEQAYETLHADVSFPYGRWQTTVERSKGGEFVPMSRIDDMGAVKKTLAYVSAYPLDGGEPRATNVIMIDQSRLTDDIRNFEIFKYGYVLVVNGDNQVIVSSNDVELPSSFPYDSLKTGAGHILYTWIDGQKYEVSSIASAQSGLHYLSLIPSSLFWEKAERVRGLTLLGALFNLLAAGLLTYYFLRRNYDPVNRLVRLISGKTRIPERQGYNEFQYLQDAIDRTLLEMDDIKRSMGQQLHILRSHFIVRLLKGRLDHQVPVDESLSKFHMTFASDDFAVLVFYVEDSRRFLETVPSLEGGDRWKWIQFLMANVVEELAADRHHGYVAEVDELFVCLVSFRPVDEEGRQKELLRIARAAQQFLGEKYKLDLTVAVSAIRSGIAGVSQAYADALDALEYKLVMGSKEIIAYEDIAAEPPEKGRIGYNYPMQTKQKLINYLSVGDAESVLQTLDEIIDHNAAERPLLSVPVAKVLMFSLLSTVIEAMDELGMDEEAFMSRDPKRFERLTSCDTIQEMRTQLKELAVQVCEYASAKRQQEQQHGRMREVDELVDRIKAFIAERYRDPNLNIALIGEHFGRKATYLSKLFKDRTGIGLLDYINRVRVGKAKELLAGGRMTIYEIAGHVGYGDVNAFIRIFKKEEGITPGKYKETVG